MPMSTAMNANIAIDAAGRTIASLCAKARRAYARARPRPLEIEAADTSVDVENLAGEEQPGADARGHGRRIDLVERNSARRDLGVVVAARLLDGERPSDEGLREPSPIVAAEVRERRPPVEGKPFQQRRGHRRGHERRERL